MYELIWAKKRFSGSIDCVPNCIVIVRGNKNFGFQGPGPGGTYDGDGEPNDQVSRGGGDTG